MTQGSHLTYLSAGSNVGDRRSNLEWALSALSAGGLTLRKVSSLFETEPVGFTEQPWFINIAIEAETTLSAEELLECSLDVERRRGRVRMFRGAPRTLDIDILFYDNLVLERPNLIIPHPRMTGRRFVLEPLAEIAPEAVHPILSKTVRQLLLLCTDVSRVRPLSTGGGSDAVLHRD